MLYSFGWFFAGGIVVFSGGAAFCFFLLTAKNPINQKKKAKCRMWAGTTSMTAKNHRRAGVGNRAVRAHDRRE